MVQLLVYICCLLNFVYYYVKKIPVKKEKHEKPLRELTSCECQPPAEKSFKLSRFG